MFPPESNASAVYTGLFEGIEDPDCKIVIAAGLATIVHLTKKV